MFQDENTRDPHEILVEKYGAEAVKASKPGHIYMDAMGFGIVSGFLRQQLDNVRFCTQQYDVQYLYITGGLAQWIYSFLSKEDWIKNKRQEIFVDEDLVIRGLSDIFAHE